MLMGRLLLPQPATSPRFSPLLTLRTSEEGGSGQRRAPSANRCSLSELHFGGKTGAILSSGKGAPPPRGAISADGQPYLSKLRSFVVLSFGRGGRQGM